jgi:hypothetical protein
VISGKRTFIMQSTGTVGPGKEIWKSGIQESCMGPGLFRGFPASRFVFLGCFLSFVLQMAAANPVTFESGPNKVQLLELFTSEGCSSCPPAEASLSRLVNDSRLWREFVPVAFHVDYWNRLGWKDPFASVEWTKRQQTYAENWKAESIYTPAFVLNGHEWRNANVPSVTEGSPGVLKIAVRGDGTVGVNFEPANGTSGEFEVYLARLGFGIKVNVRAGENNGRSLQHDFVVLSLARERLHSGTQELHLPLSAAESTAHPNRTALAAWVTGAGNIKPVQATGGWLP